MRGNLGSMVYAARNTLQSRLRGVERGTRYMRGVTLIELMTVMVVLAILTSISVGAYRRYLLRTNRSEAISELLKVQVAQEKFFLQNNSYTDDLADLGIADATPSGNYTLAVGPPQGAGGNIANGFVATATVAGGQAEDSACTSLSIDDRGRRLADPGEVGLCWR
jgi:type IV pilus assembly protein PilE